MPFFAYYNHEHRHSGIGLHRPPSVHYGAATEIREQRSAVLDAAYAANPTVGRLGSRDEVAQVEPPRPLDIEGGLPGTPSVPVFLRASCAQLLLGDRDIQYSYDLS